VDHQAGQAAAHCRRGVCRGGHRHGVKPVTVILCCVHELCC
jgi:hypothetical protein